MENVRPHRFHKPDHFLTLDDLRKELTHWQELALCNDDSAYAEAPARAALNSPQQLTQNEQANPMPVIRQFAETFTHSYIQAELLDLLEAVISYRGEKKVQLGSMVFVYQRLCFLADLAYQLT